jgi:hypothetical protein
MADDVRNRILFDRESDECLESRREDISMPHRMRACKACGITERKREREGLEYGHDR